MNRRYYLDWCPVATPPLEIFSGRPVLIDTSKYQDFFGVEATPIVLKWASDIVYCARSDGLFIFSFNPSRNFENNSKVFDVEVATNIIADALKRNLQHSHIFHEGPIVHKGRNRESYLYVEPTEIFPDDVIREIRKSEDKTQSDTIKHLSSAVESSDNVKKVFEFILGDNCILSNLRARKKENVSGGAELIASRRRAYLKHREKYSSLSDTIVSVFSEYKKSMLNQLLIWSEITAFLISLILPIIYKSFVMNFDIPWKVVGTFTVALGISISVPKYVELYLIEERLKASQVMQMIWERVKKIFGISVMVTWAIGISVYFYIYNQAQFFIT